MLAGRVGQLMNSAAIGAEAGVSGNTISSWLSLLEALKTRLNSGVEPNLFFFRNSNGLEVDLVLARKRGLDLFEVKSGKAFDKAYSAPMKNFSTKYAKHLAQNGPTVIYSGESAESFMGVRYENFKTVGRLFLENEEKFRCVFK